MNELAKLASYLASGWRVRRDSRTTSIFMAKGARYEASSLRLAGQKRRDARRARVKARERTLVRDRA